ncbi:unnamed protein product [Sphacelaria rigidula]
MVIFSAKAFWPTVLSWMLLATSAVLGSPSSATMRLMEQVHGQTHHDDSREQDPHQQLHVSKRVWVEDRACRRLHKTEHLVALPTPWFSGADIAEGFWSPEVAALAC